MVDLSTLAGLLEHQHQLAAYCPRCDRWAVLDLARLSEDGRGELCIIGWQPRCSICGGHGLLQVRPPALRPGPATALYAELR